MYNFYLKRLTLTKERKNVLLIIILLLLFLLSFEIIALSAPFTIGDKGPAGGLIFYDKGSYSDGWRYLEAAPASTEWIKKEWGRYGSLVGGTGKGIGTGQHNTNIIVAWANSQGKKGYAAQLCDALVYGDYSDWFLPSKNELNLMYKNLKVKGVGGFADGRYWSSSEDNHCDAYFQNFEHGGQFRHSKNLQYVRVRAVRAF
ncbi:MAG: DUF1566 domain-containing protein [Euryarchaeota archaeon]|nr:DUF1566 domain-containing protein [Euryarchaeota archaeon]